MVAWQRLRYQWWRYSRHLRNWIQTVFLWFATLKRSNHFYLMRLKVRLEILVFASIGCFGALPGHAGPQCSTGAWGSMKCAIGKSIFYMDSNPPQGLSNLMDIEEMPPPHPPHKLPVYEAKTNFSATKEVGCTIISPKCLDQSNNQLINSLID